MEAENGQAPSGLSHNWLTATTRSGYTGTAYVQVLPDLDALYQTSEITTSPVVAYPINLTTPATYTFWLRGFAFNGAGNAAGDSAYLNAGDEAVGVTGFAPRDWTWQNRATKGATATLVVETSGLYTLSLATREDGLRVDRLLLVTDTAYTPAGFGPAESGCQAQGGPGIPAMVDRVITYGYDDLYRLTSTDYSSGEACVYGYDPAGNRLRSVNGQPYTWDADPLRLESNNIDINARTLLKQSGGEDLLYSYP
jgi:YD repeat-containing protein